MRWLKKFMHQNVLVYSFLKTRFINRRRFKQAINTLHFASVFKQIRSQAYNLFSMRECQRPILRGLFQNFTDLLLTLLLQDKIG